jgi:hypothetical protein
VRAKDAGTADQRSRVLPLPVPAEYALANKISHPRSVYIREDAFGRQVNGWLAEVFAPGL